MRANCLVWAVQDYRRNGGIIAARRSKYTRLIPHFMWSDDGKNWWGFTPTDPKRGWLAILCCWWFNGLATLESWDIEELTVVWRA